MFSGSPWAHTLHGAGQLPLSTYFFTELVFEVTWQRLCLHNPMLVVSDRSSLGTALVLLKDPVLATPDLYSSIIQSFLMHTLLLKGTLLMWQSQTQNMRICQSSLQGPYTGHATGACGESHGSLLHAVPRMDLPWETPGTAALQGLVGDSGRFVGEGCRQTQSRLAVTLVLGFPKACLLH